MTATLGGITQGVRPWIFRQDITLASPISLDFGAASDARQPKGMKCKS